jgi:hypothetical protein
MSTSFTKCKKSLAKVWFLGAGIVFILILFQTLFGKFSGQQEKAWGWFLPTVMPTLSLMIGVLVADAKQEPAKDERKIDPFLFKLSMRLSISYFVVVLLTILVQPFTEMLILDLLEQSNLWLGPMQGLVAASLGAFFINRN